MQQVQNRWDFRLCASSIVCTKCQDSKPDFVCAMCVQKYKALLGYHQCDDDGQSIGYLLSGLYQDDGQTDGHPRHTTHESR